MSEPLWTSPGTHADGYVCVDVKATETDVILGQLHGVHGSYRTDLRLSSDDAERIAYALLDAAMKVREARA